MRTIFKQYGLTVLAVVVGILSILAVWGILKMQYETLHAYPVLESTPLKAAESYQYGGAYQVQKEEKTIETGQMVAVSDYFKVWDDKGNPGTVEVLQIVKTAELPEQVEVKLTDGKQYLFFGRPGIYTLSLRVAVPDHAAQLLEVNIPVQQAVG